MRKLKLGSLCTGYGGLDMAVEKVFGLRLAWTSDNDRHVSELLSARHPRVPNLGDISRIDWRQVDPVDVLCAGFPCQDIGVAVGRLSIRFIGGSRLTRCMQPSSCSYCTDCDAAKP